MGRDYVDDHRFWYYPAAGGAGQDITQWVSGPEARDELEALSVELTFTALRNNLYDRYMTWPGLAPGDKLKVVNHDVEVFSGVIRNVGLDGSVTANDPGWYLTKSQIILQVSNAAADDAIRRMCAKAGIPVGVLPSLPTRITKVWTGSTPEAILQDILAICSAETGKEYKRRVKNGALQVTELPTTPMVAYHKPADTGYYGTAAEEDLRGIQQEYRRKGILFVAAAIGDDKENIERIYGDSFLDITDLNQLPVKLTQVVKRFLRV